MKKFSLAALVATAQVQETGKAARSSKLSGKEAALLPKHSRHASAQPKMPPATAN